MRKVQSLLALVTKRWIPMGKTQHNVCLSDDGRLMLWLSIDIEENHIWQSFVFDEEDLDKEPEVMIEEIDVLLTNIIKEKSEH